MLQGTIEKGSGELQIQGLKASISKRESNITDETDWSGVL